MHSNYNLKYITITWYKYYSLVANLLASLGTTKNTSKITILYLRMIGSCESVVNLQLCHELLIHFVIKFSTLI